MSLWRKLNTLFKATSQAPLEELVDVNAIRIFEQELRDAQQGMNRAKTELASVIAERKRLQRHQQTLEENLVIKEGQATEALAKQEDDLALEIAEIIAMDEALRKDQAQQITYLEKQETQLRQQLRQAAHTLSRYQTELRLARANQSAEAAMSQLRSYSSGLGSQMNDMAESLDRIKNRQTAFADFDAALREVEADCAGEPLEKRIQAAGISSSDSDARAVLERLRKKQAA